MQKSLRTSWHQNLISPCENKNQKAADVWKKDVWDFQAFSQTFLELRFSLENEGKDGKNLNSQTWPGTPRRPSSRHPRPSKKKVSQRRSSGKLSGKALPNVIIQQKRRRIRRVSEIPTPTVLETKYAEHLLFGLHCHNSTPQICTAVHPECVLQCFSSFVKAARLQNETAPEKFLI